MRTSTVAAMRCKIGNTSYYVLSMKAHDLANSATFPSDNTEEWESMPLEEREQRDLNYARVKNHIAPYLAHNPDRFFGAVILAVKGDDLRFEPIDKIVRDGTTEQYKTQAEMMGFLTLKGDEVLVPLDGQHRIKALKYAISGRDDKSNPIKGVKPDFSVASDDVTVILVPHEIEKARRIFTHVNRYAKPTTTGQNWVTNDDDVVAVIARNIANDKKIIGSGLVKYKSNSLTDKEGHFTTLATIADSTLAILEVVPKLDKKDRINDDPEKLELYESQVRDTWSFLVKNIDHFANALANKDSAKDSPGDKVRKSMRQNCLLLQPMPQFCLVAAFIRLTNGRDWKLPPKQAAAKLNAIGWDKDSPFWDRVLISGGKILKVPKDQIVDLLCYMAGEPLDNKKKKDGLLDFYRKNFPSGQKPDKLPDPLP